MSCTGWTLLWIGILLTRQVVGSSNLETNHVEKSGLHTDRLSDEAVGGAHAVPEHLGSTWGKVILSLRTMLQFHCAVLLKGSGTDLRDSWLTLELEKELHAAGMPMVTVRRDKFWFYRWVAYCSSRPLYVVDGTDPSAVRWLVKLSLQPSWGLGALRRAAGRTERLANNPAWLLFLEHSQEPGVVLGGADVPINSLLLVARRLDDAIRITEVYQLAVGKSLQQMEVGEWRSPGRFSWNRWTRLKRRGNLQGTALRVAVHDFPPFAPLEISTTHTKAGGFIGKVWDIVAEQLNCSTVPHILRSPYVGEVWSSMSYGSDVALALIDYSSSAISIPFVDLSAPLFITRFHMYIRDPGHVGLGWTGFAAPFSPRLWLSVAAAIGVLVLVLTVAGRCVRSAAIQTEAREQAAALYVVGMFLQQGQTDDSHSQTLRTVYLAGYLTALVVLASYNAKLVSFLTVQTQAPLPFTDPQGLLRHQPAYNIGVPFESTSFLVILSLSDTSIQDVFNRSDNHQGRRTTSLPTSIPEGFRRVCAHNYVFFEQEDRVLAFSDHLPCDVTTLPGFALSLPVGLPFAKGSPYRALTSRTLSRLRETGILSKLLADDRPRTLPPPVQPFNSIRVASVFPVLVSLGAGFVASALLLAAEHLWARLHNSSV